MKTSTKVWLVIAGILLIALGVYCICKPAATLFSAAWMIGILVLATGISKLIFTFRTQAFLPNSATRVLSAILEILIGSFFLANSLFLAVSLPIVFALWVLIDSVIIAVNSFDYKRVGFPGWWGILILGICGAVLAVLGLKNPDVTATTMAVMIGIGIITMGVANICAVVGINKFENYLKQPVE